jgi:spore coat polysaccharide biosynthesis predicted glycosyltransferase SpsG
MRLAVLAEAAVAAGGAARVLIGGEPAASVAALRARGLDAVAVDGGEGATAIARHADELAADVVVLDGPHFDHRWIAALADARRTLASLDDRGVAPLPTPVVINPGFGAEALADRYPAARQRLLGRRYHLLRREFRALPPGGAPLADDVRRIVVTMGGSDPVGATEAVMIQLAGAGRELVVVRGPGFRNHAAVELAATVVRARGGAVIFVDDPPSLAPVLADCDAAVSAAGGTLTELAYLGRPTYAIAIVDDQVDVAARLARAGLVAGGNALAAMSPVGLGVQLLQFLDDAAGRRALAAAAAATVDGFGHVRILAALQR